MWAGSDVCGLFAENVGLFAENVGLKYGPFAENVSRTEGIFVGLRDYVCGLLHIGYLLRFFSEHNLVRVMEQSVKAGIRQGRIPASTEEMLYARQFPLV